MHFKNLFLSAIFLAGALGNPEPQANHNQPVTSVIVITYPVPAPNATAPTIPSVYTSVIAVTTAPAANPPKPTTVVSTLQHVDTVNVTISSIVVANASAVTEQPNPTRALTTTSLGTGVINATTSGTGSASTSPLVPSQPINAVNPNGAEAVALDRAVGAAVGLLVMLSFFSA